MSIVRRSKDIGSLAVRDFPKHLVRLVYVLPVDLPSPSKRVECRRRLLSRLLIYCTNSACNREAFVTDPYSKVSKSLNTRSVLAMLTIGKERAGLESFCGVMDMLPPVSTSCYQLHNHDVTIAS